MAHVLSRKLVTHLLIAGTACSCYGRTGGGGGGSHSATSQPDRSPKSTPAAHSTGSMGAGSGQSHLPTGTPEGVSGSMQSHGGSAPAAVRSSQTPGTDLTSKLSPQQQANVTQLQSDLGAIKQGSQVTPEQKQAMKNDINAMATGATKPDPATVDKLTNDLSTAMSDGNLSAKEQAQLTADMQKVLNSANIPADEVTQTISDAQAILTASGASKEDAQKVSADLQAIAQQAKTGTPQDPAGIAGTPSNTAPAAAPAGASPAAANPVAPPAAPPPHLPLARRGK